MTYEDEWMMLATIPKRLGRHRTREELDRMNAIRNLAYGDHDEHERPSVNHQMGIWEVMK